MSLIRNVIKSSVLKIEEFQRLQEGLRYADMISCTAVAAGHP
jgi:hypothetical protein